MAIKKKHLREIERINKTIPKELLDKLMKKEYVAPAIREIVERALKNPEEVKDIVSASTLRRYKAMYASGHLDQTVENPDPEIEKLINEHLDKEFEKARKLGLLPPAQKMPTLKRKAKQDYVKQNTGVVQPEAMGN